MTFNINLCYFICLGDPKIWYSIRRSDRKIFETWLTTKGYLNITCPGFWHHKDTWFCPTKLRAAGCPVDIITTIQYPGDIIVEIL